MLDTRRRRVAAVVAAVVVVLAGIGVALAVGDDDEPSAGPASTTTSTSSTSAAPAVLAPLTGLPGDLALVGRPALVVKIDNAQAARPQVGINQADVVYEERVEGSVTRLLAVFHSTDSSPVGPIRSARTSDIGIVSMLNRPLFAWSGANRDFAARIRAANLLDVGYDAASGLYYRERSRRGPHNLFARGTSDLLALPHEGSAAPAPLFSYRPAGAPAAGAEAVGRVRVSFGSGAGAAPVEWSWDGEKWARTQAGTPHTDPSGAQVAAANVVVQFVAYAPTATNDQFGVPIREAQLVGEGEVWVLTGGGLVPGRWRKPSIDAVTEYLDAAGRPIALAPGRTWVELPLPGDAARIG